MISPDSVEKVRDLADIVDVIGEFITLKKRGVNFLGLCPFHNEKTPSFTVSPNKGIYKCFGCGESGNAFKFIMEHEHLSFPDAVRYLAKKYQIEIEDNQDAYDATQANFRESLYIVNKHAKEQFHNNLLKTDEGQSIGMNYLKSRGFNEQVITQYELGYGMETRDTFTKDAVNRQFDLSTLQKLGLTTTHEKDFFSARIIFPIHNLSGKVIGFGGRTLKSNPKIPKYLNSPESDIYNKSRVLYGLYHAKKAIRQEDECILVEGYTDVLSLAQHGIQNCVASSGTSLTDGQIGLIKRYTPNICIVFDGDKAGMKASFRGIDLILGQDMNVNILPLPEGEDPDSFAKTKGEVGFKSYLEAEKKNFILFKMKMLLEDAKDDPIKMSSLVKDIVLSISKIPDNIKRAVFIKQCSRELKMDEQSLFNALNEHLYQKIKQQPQKETPKPIHISIKSQKKSNEKFDQERDIMRVILEHGTKMLNDDCSVAEFIHAELEEAEFKHPIHKKIISIFNDYMFAENKYFSPKTLIENDDKTISEYCIDLSLNPDELSENWEKRHGIFVMSKEDNHENDVYQAVARFQLKRIEKLIQLNLKELLEEKDEDNIIILQKQNMMLNTKKNEIAQFLSTVITKT